MEIQRKTLKCKKFYKKRICTCSYLRTTDKPPIGKTEILAEKTETYTTRFWAETFGSFQIGISFCTGFILQLFRFHVHHL